MKSWLKSQRSVLIVMPIISLQLGLSQLSLAVQPVSDAELAESASLNAIVLDERIAENKVFIIEEDTRLGETPAFQSMNILSLLYPDDFIREIDEQQSYFTRNFGSEFYSYRWAGNLDQIWAANPYYEFSYNVETDRYELNNMRGRVWTSVEPYRSGSE